MHIVNNKKEKKPLSTIEKVLLSVLIAYTTLHGVGVFVMLSHGEVRSGSIIWLFVLIYATIRK